MKQWITVIQAKDPLDGVLKTWFGPNVPGNTIEEAITYVQQNGLGYCMVAGELVCEIDEKDITVDELYESGIDEGPLNVEPSDEVKQAIQDGVDPYGALRKALDDSKTVES